MCVLIQQPGGKSLDKETAKALWTRNPDGGGFSFLHDGQITTKKTMSWEKWWSLYRNYVTQFPEADFMLHMRIATHGVVDTRNVHPFRVDEHTVMGHNGIIPGALPCDTKDDRSDTKIFAQHILSFLDETWLDDDTMVDFIGDAIGNSKLVFMTTNPLLKEQTYIINSYKGTELDGMWFSNTIGITNTAFYKKHGPQPKPKTKSVTFVSAAQQAKDNNRKQTDLVKTAKKALGGRVETSSSWDVWEYMNETNEEILLKRKEAGFTQRTVVQWVDSTWRCQKCQASVTLNDIECDCYELLCTVCGDFAAWCPCEQPEFRVLGDGEVPPVEQYLQDKDKQQVEGVPF